MAQGAVYKLVLRDERFDKYFTASAALRERLDDARERRRAAGEANVQPTYRDLAAEHTVYVRATHRPYVAVASEYVRVRPAGDGAAAIGAGSRSVTFTLPAVGHFTSDIALHVRFPAVGSAAAAAAGDAPTAAAPLYRYCAYPGLRLLRRVELRSDEALLDDYTADDAVAYGKFFVRSDQRAGWARCHGQQETQQADYVANGYTATLLYRDGPQTPKLYQEPLDMFVPLQFWLCRDASQALLSDLDPRTQRTIRVELAPLDELLGAFVPSAAPGAGGELARAALPFASLGVELALYVNGLWVNPEVYDIFATRIGFSLVHAHRREVKPVQSVADRILLNQLKYPAEFLTVGFRDRRNALSLDHWWLMGTAAARPNRARLIVPAMIWNPLAGACQLVCREATETDTLEPFVESLGVVAHGIELFQPAPPPFYGAYLPVRYANAGPPVTGAVVAPADTSAYLVPFCLYPGQPDPSGYYNLSAGRELYLTYAFRPGAPLAADYQAGRAEVVVSMSALNFLARRGDRLSLVYSL